MVSVEEIRKITDDSKEKRFKKSLRKLYKVIDAEIRREALAGFSSSTIYHVDKYFAFYDVSFYFSTVKKEYPGYSIDYNTGYDGQVDFIFKWDKPDLSK